MADRLRQPTHPLGADPDHDLGSWCLALVRRTRFGPVGSEIEAVRPFETAVQWLGAADPRHAIRPELALGPGNHVPDACLEDEPERLELAGHDLVAPPVVDLDGACFPDRVGHRGEVRRFLADLEPAGRVEVEALDEP